MKIKLVFVAIVLFYLIGGINAAMIEMLNLFQGLNLNLQHFTGQ